ncbi:multidrug resistance protein 1-like isoform X1 [Dendronephthya gigantea]|uniref:multidrug resistance protein 1-like isoform X1 n=1 Tax=Dendronephthya gigantea TaxID=151771 RepID=UPI00106CA628|nr:multidrug resistance protein 1-like isoform X1 [Dendronephthya gigantea]
MSDNESLESQTAKKQSTDSEDVAEQSPVVQPYELEPAADSDYEEDEVDETDEGGILLEETLEAKLKKKGAASSGETADEKKLVPVGQLFRFADGRDKFLMFLGVIGSIIFGAIAPVQCVLMGELVDDFVDFTICQKNANCTNPPDLEDSMTTIGLWYVGFSIANFLFAWMGLGLFGLAAERQAHKMRLALFRSAVHQEIGWFDAHTSGELINRLTEDINKIADGIGAKYGRILSSIVSFIVSYAIGFVYVWQLTLVMFSLFPLMVIVGAMMSKLTGTYAAKELEAYSKAGHVAEESISSIRTVAAFGGELKQAELYESKLDDAAKYGIKKGLGTGIGMGCFQMVNYINYALSFWYVIKLTRDGDATAGDGMLVFFAVSLGSLMLGQAAPSGEALAAAQGAAFAVFHIIDRKSEIDASADGGLKPTTIRGDVTFSNVDFSYPTRKAVKILGDFNLEVKSGKRVALVGESGCGKSTIVKLVQRFYKPLRGTVLIDGNDISTFNVRHLRRFIGVVNQEPVLFATTIAENIAFGKEGATKKEIEEAARLANAHDFITNFPDGYETLCGERGVQMSGGQKQRIAIARALIRNPKILLLDEATSALDSESEAVVQEALDRAGEGRTTIIIAHRLSTVRDADSIAAVSEGHIKEIGSHDELVAKKGLYHTLLKMQEKGKDDVSDDEDDMRAENDFERGEAIDGAFKLGSVGGSTLSGSFVTKTQIDDDGRKPVSFRSLIKLSAPEWKYLVVGCFGSILYGTFPFLYGKAYGGLFDTFSYDPKIPDENEEMDDESKKWAVVFLLIGLESGIGIFLQNWYLAKAGEALTKRLRKKAFLAFLRQEISYYDLPNHGTGAICSRLATEVSSIQGATGPQLGLLLAGIVTVIGGLIVSLTASWQLALLMMAFIPLLVGSGMFMNAFFGSSKESLSRGGNTAEETFSNIQTVVSLGREEEFYQRYQEEMIIPYRRAKKTSHFSGLSNGFFFGIMNLSYGAGFRYGGYLVEEGDVNIEEMMTSIITVLICCVVLGQLASITPDYKKAKEAAERVFYLLGSVPDIDVYSEDGSKPETCNGEITFAGVRFRYPTRRNLKVLRGLDLTVKPGQTVALVGTSGCGKSTTVSLVERFYDTNAGHVMVDGVGVGQLNLKWLRRQIGVVSQEPVLFDLSIRDNIAFGDTSRKVSDMEVEKAAQEANIHQFIVSLPKGYDTIVGDKGTLISGGQKQRIAIARALIRDPKILLLDEATSALDTESEKVVQEALDKASIGRTTLVIAHRLSTIQHADAICVIRQGRVVERGTHHQLLAMKGIYYAHNKALSLKKE